MALNFEQERRQERQELRHAVEIYIQRWQLHSLGLPVLILWPSSDAASKVEVSPYLGAGNYFLRLGNEPSASI